MDLKSGLSNLSIIPANSLGENGIKFRNDKGLIVLKTKSLGNNRLVTEYMHKDGESNLLIVFNKVMNHSAIDKYTKSDIINFDTAIGGDQYDSHHGEETELGGEVVHHDSD